MQYWLSHLMIDACRDVLLSAQSGSPDQIIHGCSHSQTTDNARFAHVVRANIDSCVACASPNWGSDC